MELFNFYNSIFTVLFGLKGSVAVKEVMIASVAAVAVWLTLFILQGVGLYVMARRRDMEKKWLVFVPFVNLYYIGKLTGDCILFGRKMKRPGLYAMIAQIVATLFMAAYTAVSTLLFVGYGDYLQPSQYGYGYEWVNLPAAAEPLRRFIWVCDGGGGMIGLTGIIDIVYWILLLILMIGLFRKYAPQQATMFSLFSFFVPVTRFVFIFALRNRQAIDYEAYMRKQREEFIRRQQQQGQYGPYGPYGPYRGGYSQGPYGGNSNGGQQQSAPRPPEDPFAEFGENGEKKNLESGEKKSGSDDFFS